jgi:2-polyprenyl-3-methyl-5-hydroxy-6-metoxy-1,4-benzoquinol methylase
MKQCSVCKKKTAGVYRSKVKSVYSKKAYDILHCSNCNHYFTDPIFTQAELDDIYTHNYSYDAHSLIEREKRMRASKYAKYIANIEGVNSALEVGCMHGLLLVELEKNGIKAAGVELDPEAVNYCKKLGLDVTQSSIENHLKKADSKHDAIIMSHVIEHIVDSEAQLKSLNKRMSKDGRLVLITPNSMSRSRKVFGRYWGYWQVPVHINHYNKQSMTELLRRSGFKLEDYKHYGGDSLFFLSSLANLLGAGGDTKKLSAPKRALVRIATVVLKPWYHFGREDMVVIATKA